MKLLPPQEAKKSIQKQNDELVAINVRLKKYERDIRQRINILKDTYEPDKLKKYEEFTKYCNELEQKKSDLLKNMMDIEKMIEGKRDILYGLIEKQDILQEKELQLRERENKLEMRQAFVEELERKQYELNYVGR